MREAISGVPLFSFHSNVGTLIQWVVVPHNWSKQAIWIVYGPVPENEENERGPVVGS